LPNHEFTTKASAGGTGRSAPVAPEASGRQVTHPAGTLPDRAKRPATETANVQPAAHRRRPRA
jgi:hypothetical protein